MKNKGIYVKYILLQAIYFMLFCAGYAYATYFFREAGYGASAIGVITAICGVLAALLQTELGNLADRNEKFGWKKLLFILLFISILLLIGLFLFHSKTAMLILYGLFFITVSAMMPLANAACFYYQEKGIHIDFGKARAGGSISFALMSYLLGIYTVKFGATAVTVGGMIVTLLMLLLVFFLPWYGDAVHKTEEAHTDNAVPQGSFVKKYPAFIIMLIGLILILSCHATINTYLLMIVENVGGNSGTFGTATSIAAVSEVVVLLGFSLLIKRWSAKSLLFVAGVSYCLRALILMFAGQIWEIYLAQLLQAPSFALYASASAYYADETMMGRDKVKGQALMTSALMIGTVIGNLQGGFSLDALGIRPMLGISLLITAVGTVLIFIACKKKNNVPAVQKDEA